MGDNPYKQVQGPEGIVNFPSAMSDEDIGSAMRRLYPPHSDTQAHVGQWHPSAWEQIKSAVPAVGRVSDLLSGKVNPMSSMPLEAAQQVVRPENVYSQYEQQQHPIRTGFDQVLGGLTSPDNLLLMQGMKAAGAVPALPRVASGVFGAQMGHGAIQAGEGALDAARHGNWGEAKRLGTIAALQTVGALGAGFHALTGDVPPEAKGVPAKTDPVIAGTGKTESQIQGENRGSSTSMASTPETAKPGEQPLQTAGQEPRRGEPVRPSEGPKIDRAASDAAFNRNYPEDKFKGMSPMEKDLWQQSVFGQEPPKDIGSKIRNENPEPTRDEVKRASEGKGPDAPTPSGLKGKDDITREGLRRLTDPEYQALAKEYADINNRLSRKGIYLDYLGNGKFDAYMEDGELWKKDVQPEHFTDPDISERIRRAKDLAKQMDLANAGPSPSEKSPLEERLEPNAELDRKADEAMGTPPKDWQDRVSDVTKNYDQIRDAASQKGFERVDAEHDAQTGGRPGEASIPGVEDSGLEELNKIFSLEDLRDAKKHIDDFLKDKDSESGRLSLKAIKPIHPLSRLADVIENVGTLGGALDKTPEELQARQVTRAYAADMALKHLQLEAKLRDRIDAHDNDGKTEFLAFMDAGEGKKGAAFLGPEDQAMATELHRMFQERWNRVQNILGQNLGSIQDYLSHIWEQPGLAKTALNRLFSRKPITGRAGFLKQRVYQYASDGVNAGLTPITWNPIRMQLAALYQLDKFLAGHELKDVYKSTGLVEWYKIGEKHPDGWQTLDDRIFEPKTMDKGGLKQYGQYWAPPDVAKIFNRYVSPGLRGNPTYDAIRSYGNLLNQVNLGVSGYHGIFISLVSSMTDTALGIEKVFNNRDLGGIKNVLRGTLGTFIGQSPRMFYKLGKTIQAEAIRPTGNTRLQAYVDSIIDMGGRFEQDPMYDSTWGRKWFKDLSQNPIKAIANGVWQGAKFTARHPIEGTKEGIGLLAKPIMKYYVPRVKIGMAAKMMEAKADYLIKNNLTAPDMYANEMSKIWDSIDNRAGQMVYDNLFWNKTAKDLAFLAVRAVGWDYGSGREYLGAGKDLALRAASKLRGGDFSVPGEGPVSTRMAFTVATVMTMGVLGAVTTYLATGKAPKSMEDYFYPPSGRLSTNGKPERMSYPSYVKDMYAVGHDVTNLKADTALHKLHPNFGQLYEFFTNKDFYGTEIRSEGDPWYQQGWQVLKWYAKSFAPFSGSMAQQRMKSGVPAYEAYPESFFGLMRAPAYVTNTKAEELALDFSKKNWKAGPLSSRDREQRDTYDTFRAQLSQGKLDTRQVSEAFRSGKLRASDLDRLFDSSHLSTLQSEFKGLGLPEALKVYNVADQSEKQQLKPFLIDKIGEIDKQPPEAQGYYSEQLQKALAQ